MDIRLKSVKNIRDFSQYGYPDCIRSGHLGSLTEADAAVLVERHGLRTVIDLRTPQEAAERPDVRIPGVTYHHIPIFDGAVPGVSHEAGPTIASEAEARRNLAALREQIPDMPTFYRLMATSEPYLSRFAAVMALIDAPREGAILWHCTEGKDRCGLVSARFLLSRGVERREVLRDYLRTRRVSMPKAWKYYFLVLLATKDPTLAAHLRDALSAKPTYLAPLLDTIAAWE